MPVSGSALRQLLPLAAALLLGAAPAAALAEDAPLSPVSPPAAVEEQAPANAAPQSDEALIDEGSVEPNTAPSTVPGFGGEAPMCPHHRGQQASPSV